MAELCGNQVGFVLLQPLDGLLYIANISVSPDLAGLGIGRLLMTAAEHRAQQIEACRFIAGDLSRSVLERAVVPPSRLFANSRGADRSRSPRYFKSSRHLSRHGDARGSLETVRRDGARHRRGSEMSRDEGLKNTHDFYTPELFASRRPERLPHLDILDRTTAFRSRIPSLFDPPPTFVEDAGAFIESPKFKASPAVRLSDLMLRVVHQPRSDAVAPRFWIDMQIFDAILCDMDEAHHNIVHHGYEKRRPHGFGVRTSWVSSGENLNGLKRQFRSPGHQLSISVSM